MFKKLQLTVIASLMIFTSWSQAQIVTQAPAPPLALAVAVVNIYDINGILIATAQSTGGGNGSITLVSTGAVFAGVIGTRGNPASSATLSLANNAVYEFTAIPCPGQPGRNTLHGELNGADVILFCWQ